MKNNLLSILVVLCFSLSQAQTEVTFYTTKGNFVVEIYDNIVPITGGNFLTLVNQEFYDGVIFHRVIDNFMIQGGDPTGTGSGGPGYTIQDEFDASLSNVQKTISMANAGPNTGGSQFFINLVDNTYLDFNKPPTTSKHPVFGMTIENFSVVQDIGKVPTNASDRPLTPVVMDSIRVGNYTVGMASNVNPISSFRVYPNPVDMYSVVELVSKRDKSAQVVLWDATGKKVAEQNLGLNAGYNKFYVSDMLQQMPTKGMYQLSIMTDEGVKTLKILVP
jgi:peptidylprolyl isomerase